MARRQRLGPAGGSARRDLHPEGRRGAGHPHPRQAGRAAAHRRGRHAEPGLPRRAAQHRRARTQGLHLPLLRQRHRVRLRAPARRGTGRRAARRRPVLPARQRGGGGVRRRIRTLPVPPSPPWSRPSSSSPASAPSTSRTRPGSAAGCWTGWPSSRRCPTSPTAKKNPSQAAGELSAHAAHPGQRRGDGGALHGRQTRPRRPGLRRPRGPRRPGRQRDPGGRGNRTPAVQGGAAGRVPGHLARPAGPVLPAVRRRPRRHGRGGSEPVHLRVPRRLRRPALPLRPRIPGPARAGPWRTAEDGDADAGSTARFAVAPTSYLTTAWRNGRNILAAANVISAPLSAAAAQTGPAGERDTAGSRRGSAAAAQPGRGPGPGGDGALCHRRGRGRGDRRRRAEVPGD